MKDEIISNLKYLSTNNKNDLLYVLDNKLSNDYFTENYKLIMDGWNKKYDCFDIPNILIANNINDKINYYSTNDILNKNSIFDIASISKAYTEYILFNVIDDYNININNKIKDLVDFYENIKELQLLDLIKFNNRFYTKIDIRECKNKKDAIKALRTVFIDENEKGFFFYSDLPIMIITDILETITNLSYKELFEKYIIKKHGLKNTFLDLYNDDNYITLNKNYTNDPKANIMGGYFGHCGVKATAEDLTIFLGIILDSDYLQYFVTDSDLIKKDGTICNVGIVGNSNISSKEGNLLTSNYMSKVSFALQGSLRCHAEVNLFVVNNKKYKVISCIFNDLYTQYDNILKYEKKNDVKISKEYYIDGIDDKLIMCDIRSILPYTSTFKDIINTSSIISIIDLYNSIK